MQGPRLSSHSAGPILVKNLSKIPIKTNQDQEKQQEEDLIQEIPSSSRNSSSNSINNDNNNNEDNNYFGNKSEGYLEGDDDPPISPEKEISIETKWNKLKRVLLKQAGFLGPGVIAAVAYIDPGNWATDLQSGSQFGYAQLFVVLIAGLIALLFQTLCTRLGSVTGLDLAQQCRIALHDRPKHKMFYRWGMLYPLYVISEVGIILTDLAELLGSAIAINLIFPAIPLPVCVVLTAIDVILILLLFDQYPTTFVTRSMRLFELMIGVLMFTVLGSFIALLVRVEPVWPDVFAGYLPSAGIVNNGGIYSAVGILGATIMLHALYLGSKVATMRRVQPSDYEEISSTTDLVKSSIPISSPAPSAAQVRDQMIYEFPNVYSPKPTLACVRAHLPYAQVDLVFSLVCFAIVINSSILIVSAAVFFYGSDATVTSAVAAAGGVSNLFDAYELVRTVIGPAFGYLFAIGLFAAGQAASLTVTLSGQIISEGFIHWKTVPWKRRLVTRAIGIIPSLAVAIAVGKDGIDVLLVGSQVGLSIILPFVLFPLIIFTSSHHLMAIPIDPTTTLKSLTPIPTTPNTEQDLESSPTTTSPSTPPMPPFFFPSLNALPIKTTKDILKTLNPFRKRINPEGTVSFVNSVFIIYLAGFLFIAINAANFYAIVELGLGSV